MKIREHIQGGDGSLDLNFEHNGTIYGGFVEWRSGGKADAVVIKDSKYAIARDFAVDDVDAAVRAAADTLASSNGEDTLTEQPQITEVTDFGEEILTPVADRPLDMQEPEQTADKYVDNDDIGDDGKVTKGKVKHRRRPARRADPSTDDDKIVSRF